MSKSASRVLQFPAEPRRFIRPPRVMRRVIDVLNHVAEVSPKYFIHWWTQLLECGHKVTAYDFDTAAQKRRLCPKCSHALRLAMCGELIQLASLRKLRRQKDATA